MRTPLIAANWKMNYGKPAEAVDFVRRIRRQLAELETVDIVLCPPFTALTAVGDALRGSRIWLGAQTIHAELAGAHTGEISAPMIQGECAYVILGHSERRASGSTDETDEAIRRKIEVALAHELIPIVCVGENLGQNEAGQTAEVVGGQVRSAFSGLAADRASRCLIAYEPIWAIGTGKAATPAEANTTVSLTIRVALAELLGQSVAETLRVLYGGSVTPDNIAAFMTMPDLDGALVGGASLKDDFPLLVQQAAAAKSA
ncbi:MAG TPA: triose-phosphate isomerase [Anaerolineales bacterium]|nr:triose-phosphate isomerase [Anaerolineales bacterium]